MMKKYKTAIALEFYALVLALIHMPRGVVTDEAKYLLNIPYPHPPLVRSLMNLTEWMPMQEFFWRVVIATIVVQSVAFVWSLGKQFTEEQRKVLAEFWLLSAAVLLQAGTVMMAPLTAVQALIFVWLLDRKQIVEKFPAYVSLFWLVSLFTAYQIVLFLPIVVLVFWRANIKRNQKLACVGLPLVLLALYTLSNPLIPASMLDAGTQNMGIGAGQKLEYILLLWAIGGSVVASGLGTVGMFIKKRWELVASLVLLIIYVSLSYRFYYAILFTPLFIAGVVAAPRVLCNCAVSKTLLGLITIGIFLQYGPDDHVSVANQVGYRLRDVGGLILIDGSYGHEWQYELPHAPLQYHESLVPKAQALICLEGCNSPGESWHKVDTLPIDVWVQGK